MVDGVALEEARAALARDPHVGERVTVHLVAAHHAAAAATHQHACTLARVDYVSLQ